MAKLEDRVNTLELLDAIRDGAVKPELIKKYRTSEAELASALHPLFRTGKMTAEEFNNFFKGLPVSRPEPAPTAELAGTGAALDGEPPSSRIVIPLEQSGVLTPDGAHELEPEPVPTVEEGAAITEILPALSSETADGTAGEIVPEEPPGVEAHLSTDSAGVTSIMNMIFSRLTAIDNRLAQIERKLGKFAR